MTLSMRNLYVQGVKDKARVLLQISKIEGMGRGSISKQLDIKL